MPYDIYKNRIAGLAQDEASGNDIDDEITAFAGAAGVDPDMIRHEVTEMAQNVE